MFRKPLGTVSYHADVMLQYECIEEVRREPRGGAEEHFYRVKPRASLGARSWQHVPAALKDDFVSMSLESFRSRVIQALSNGAFEDGRDSTFSWQPIMVDEPGWKEIQEIREEVEARFQSVADRSRRRLGPHDGIPLIVGIAAVKTGDR
ncbi:MAG: hypothetical protein ACJ76B_07925 [Solirubrobacterales bacterium]